MKPLQVQVNKETKREDLDLISLCSGYYVPAIRMTEHKQFYEHFPH